MMNRSTQRGQEERPLCPVLDAIAGWPMWLVVGMSMLAGVGFGLWLSGLVMRCAWGS